MYSKRERAVGLAKLGLKNYEIAEEIGCSASWVGKLLEPRARKKRMLREEKIRRAKGLGTYECGVCGERGHNARRHRDPSDA